MHNLEHPDFYEQKAADEAISAVNLPVNLDCPVHIKQKNNAGKQDGAADAAADGQAGNVQSIANVSTENVFFSTGYLNISTVSRRQTVLLQGYFVLLQQLRPILRRLFET